MMNIPPSEAEALSLWKYEALLYHWNKAHGGDDSPKEPPASKVPWSTTKDMMDRIKADPVLSQKTKSLA